MEFPAGHGVRPFIVCGDNPMALRLAETLVTQYERPVIAIVRPGVNRWTAHLREVAGVQVITAEVLDRTAFATARLRDAEALALVEQDDAGNVDAALLAQEINPELRIVIRMSKQSLGERMSSLLHNCVALSASAIAAPAFVAAALGVAATPPIQLGDRTVVGILRERTRQDDVLAGLAIMGPRGTVPELLPPEADYRADFVLARSKPAPPPRPPRTSDRRLVFSLVFGRRMRTVIAVFLVFYALGTAALALAQGTTWGDAAYGALMTALTGNADDGVTGLPARIAVVLLALMSIALIPAVTATIVDALVKVRLQREAGGLHEPVSGHYIVVGLGQVGSRVVRALHDEGVSVVAIEKDASRFGVQVARDLKIPVIIGEASRAGTLERASVQTAIALIVVSTDDVTNLEVGLLGQAAKPDLRVVLRIFDGEFADRIRRSFNIATSRSVSYLAAPAFAAAMIGRSVLATIPVRRHVVLLAELPIGDGSELEHQTVAAVNRPGEVRVLAIRTAEQVLWRPAEGRPLRTTDRLIVAATRGGLSRLLGETLAGSGSDEARPYRLLQPWELPHPRPQPRGSTEGTGSNPPFGPADSGSTRPA
jgi:Trk K+ transport system NAD-binding subunit